MLKNVNEFALQFYNPYHLTVLVRVEAPMIVNVFRLCDKPRINLFCTNVNEAALSQI